MDTYLLEQILKALTQGEFSKVVGYGLVFIFIWIEVRGMKKQLITLNKNFAQNLTEGEARFERIEAEVKHNSEEILELKKFVMP